MAKAGSRYLIYTNEGTELIPNWQPIGGQRDLTISETAESFDGGDKLVGVATQAGDITREVSGGGVYIRSNAGQASFESAFRQKQQVKIRLYEDGNAFEEMFVVITSRNRTMSRGDIAQFDFTGGVVGNPVAL